MTSSWEEVYEIVGDGTSQNTGYDISVNNDGNVLAVGTRLSDTASVTNGGDVTIYRKDVTTGEWSSDDTIYGATNNRQYGYSMSLSGDGNTIVIGTNAFRSKTVMIYKYSGGTWDSGYTLSSTTHPNDEISNYFGYNVDVNYHGNIISITNPYEDADGLRVGSVLMY